MNVPDSLTVARSVGRATACTLATAIALAAAPRPAAAQMDSWGQIDLAAVHGYDTQWNRQIRGDDAFNEVRLRLFGQHWVNEQVGVFAELLFDIEARARVNGAYVVINDLFDQPWLGARVGLSPSLIGTHGMRSSYFNQSGLVGMPMLRSFRTTMDNGGRATPDDLMRRKGENRRDVPILYDACWNISWELLGSIGSVSYDFGVTSGSVSNPLGPVGVPGVQFMGRLGYRPALGVVLGLSAVHGPYIGESNPASDIRNVPVVEDPENWDQQYLGLDVEVSRGTYEIFGEAYRNWYALPNVQERVAVQGAYLEARWWLLSDVFVAGRSEIMDFGGITVPTFTELQDWDDDVRRFEAAIGYRMTREAIARLGYQRTTFTQGTDPRQNVLIAQISAVF